MSKISCGNCQIYFEHTPLYDIINGETFSFCSNVCTVIFNKRSAAIKNLKEDLSGCCIVCNKCITEKDYSLREGQYLFCNPMHHRWFMASDLKNKGYISSKDILKLWGTYGPPPDTVNHPKHYTSHPSKIECISITEHMSFCLGNAIKYIWRADHKNGLEDLKKAIWYLNREIAKRESDNG